MLLWREGAEHKEGPGPGGQASLGLREDIVDWKAVGPDGMETFHGNSLSSVLCRQTDIFPTEQTEGTEEDLRSPMRLPALGIHQKLLNSWSSPSGNATEGGGQ